MEHLLQPVPIYRDRTLQRSAILLKNFNALPQRHRNTEIFSATVPQWHHLPCSVIFNLKNFFPSFSKFSASTNDFENCCVNESFLLLKTSCMFKANWSFVVL